MGLGRRRRIGRRPLRLGRRPPSTSSVPAAKPGQAVDPESEESTLIDAPHVKAPLGGNHRAQDDTEAQLRAMPRPDPNEETEGALDNVLPPMLPPDQILFKCPCGVKLMAKRPNYDKRLRCGGCKTELLLNLVFMPDTGRFMIEPFRVDPLPDLGS